MFAWCTVPRRAQPSLRWSQRWARWRVPPLSAPRFWPPLLREAASAVLRTSSLRSTIALPYDGGVSYKSSICHVLSCGRVACVRRRIGVTAVRENIDPPGLSAREHGEIMRTRRKPARDRQPAGVSRRRGGVVRQGASWTVEPTRCNVLLPLLHGFVSLDEVWLCMHLGRVENQHR